MSIAPLISAYNAASAVIPVVSAQVERVTDQIHQAITPESPASSFIRQTRPEPLLPSRIWTGLKSLFNRARYALTGAAVTTAAVLTPSVAHAKTENPPPATQLVLHNPIPETILVNVVHALFFPTLTHLSLIMCRPFFGDFMKPMTTDEVIQEPRLFTGASHYIGRIAANKWVSALAHVRNVGLLVYTGISIFSADTLKLPHFFNDPEPFFMLCVAKSWTTRARVWLRLKDRVQAGLSEEEAVIHREHALGIRPVSIVTSKQMKRWIRKAESYVDRLNEILQQNEELARTLEEAIEEIGRNQVEPNVLIRKRAEKLTTAQRLNQELLRKTGEVGKRIQSALDQAERLNVPSDGLKEYSDRLKLLDAIGQIDQLELAEKTAGLEGIKQTTQHIEAERQEMSLALEALNDKLEIIRPFKQETEDLVETLKQHAREMKINLPPALN